MYDIRPLEEQWKQYRKKKLRPWYIGGLIFIILSFVAFIIFNRSQMNFNALTAYWNKNNTVSLNDKINYPARIESKTVVHGPLIRLEVEQKQMIDESKTVEDTHEDVPPDILVDIPILDGHDDEEHSNDLSKPRKKVHLDIIKTTAVTAYKDVENRFRQSHDIDDSLFLARSYYKKGNYTKAEYWAMETNKVDSDIEESILIFVKSKMKLGRKNEAINILSTYIKKSNSQEAKKLLYTIENGKF